MRVKVAKPKDLMRQARSKVAERRPRCPNCQQRMPAPDEPREYWLEPFGHRRPDGEPCPGFKAKPSLAPPPPLHKPEPERQWPATVTGPTKQMVLFQVPKQQVAASKAKAAKRKREAKTASSAPPQLLLFVSIEQLWTDLQASDVLFSEVRSENCQENDLRPQSRTSGFCEVSGVEQRA